MCLLCLHDLPLTYFWDYDVPPIEKLFWGRLPVAAACAYLHFEQQNRTQMLMHRLKYEGKTGVGTVLGRQFGLRLKEKGWFRDVDLIVPLPLHFTRLQRRGYNQSYFIAEGIRQVYDVPLRTHALQRVVATETQTRRSRFDRAVNVESVFRAEERLVRGRNLLLVDDVVTTGATLISAGEELHRAGINKLYIATLAIA